MLRCRLTGTFDTPQKRQPKKQNKQKQQKQQEQEEQQKQQQLVMNQSLVEVKQEVKTVLSILGLLSSVSYSEVIWVLACSHQFKVE